MTDWKHIHEQAKCWLKEAGKKIRQSLDTEMIIETKLDPSDLVTNVDKEIEQFFKNNIQETFPTHHMLGEEGYGENLETLDGTVWIIDPIDGTMNFIYQQRHFAISIGIFEDGVGMFGYVYDVATDELYHAKKGEGIFLNDRELQPLKTGSLHTGILAINGGWIIRNKEVNVHKLHEVIDCALATRSYGSAALSLAYIAAGFVDAYITMRLSPWDFAGGLILVEEAGGVVTDLVGEPLHLLKSSTVLAGKQNVHAQIVEMLKNK